MIENITQIKSGITINVDVSAKFSKLSCVRVGAWNLSTCIFENSKY